MGKGFLAFKEKFLLSMAINICIGEELSNLSPIFVHSRSVKRIHE